MSTKLIKTIVLLQLLSILFFSTKIPKSTSTPNYVYSDCPSTTFPTNSLYTTNVNHLLNSLATKASVNPTNFYSTSSGNDTKDVVYGLYLCRGDQNTTGCTDCVVTATTSDIPNVYCPSSRVAVVWYEECMIRYSNESLLGVMSYTPFELIQNAVNGRNYDGNQTLFNEVVMSTMNGLVNRTANDGGRKFVTQVLNFTRSDTLYAMQQCTPDLSAKDCGKCLTTAISRLQIGKGSTLLQPSCQIRYELFPFYNDAVGISPGSTSPSLDSSKTGKLGKTIGIGVSVAAFILIIALTIICLIKRRAKKYHPVLHRSVSEDFGAVESLQYDLATLQLATNNFSEENKLGEGGFGSVYKGTLSNGQEVAVKRLSKSSIQGAQEFKTEVLLVAKLQHRRLARLLGFCIAGIERLLVYEYVPNKSLDGFLFDPEKKVQLDWNTRYKIIRGVARGIMYLHQDSRHRIIHRDLKASNILLDVDMSPKISDFGLAKICGVDQTHGNTNRVVGTYGYMAPEYAMQGKFSTKSDVYSFGVLVLEIISGMNNNTFYKFGYAEDLLSYAWKQWKEGKAMEFVDATIRKSCSINEVKACMHLGLLCVQERVDERPSMTNAVLMLDGQSVSIPTPTQPAFFTKSVDGSTIDGSDQVISVSVPWTMNDASISEIEPR
ncbi:hypothetical protein RND81_10G017100 [Saponaria officinalis]|uniref:non-specific serine/threonine protein kinase n=1 Tax=Saponaria officinalis TaxID=3572 RepID=A0AAW1HXU7_SAPOF